MFREYLTRARASPTNTVLDAAEHEWGATRCIAASLFKKIVRNLCIISSNDSPVTNLVNTGNYLWWWQWWCCSFCRRWSGNHYLLGTYSYLISAWSHGGNNLKGVRNNINHWLTGNNDHLLLTINSPRREETLTIFAPEGESCSSGTRASVTLLQP